MRKQPQIILLCSRKDLRFDSTKESFMKEAGEDKLDRDQEFKFGPMEQGTKANGSTTRQTGWGNLFTLMAMYMRANGTMIRHQGKVSTFIAMVPNMMENGLMIFNMARV